jgi:hypothetical protein
MESFLHSAQNENRQHLFSLYGLRRQTWPSFLISTFEAQYISPLRNQRLDLNVSYCRVGNHTYRACSVISGGERHRRKGQDKAKSPKDRKEIGDEQFRIG